MKIVSFQVIPTGPSQIMIIGLGDDNLLYIYHTDTEEWVSFAEEDRRQKFRKEMAQNVDERPPDGVLKKLFGAK